MEQSTHTALHLPGLRPAGERQDHVAFGPLKQDIKPWQKKMWCIPKVDGEFAARVEDVRALYAEPPDARRPVVWFDETPRRVVFHCGEVLCSTNGGGAGEQ